MNRDPTSIEPYRAHAHAHACARVLLIETKWNRVSLIQNSWTGTPIVMLGGGTEFPLWGPSHKGTLGPTPSCDRDGISPGTRRWRARAKHELARMSPAHREAIVAGRHCPLYGGQRNAPLDGPLSALLDSVCKQPKRNDF